MLLGLVVADPNHSDFIRRFLGQFVDSIESEIVTVGIFEIDRRDNAVFVADSFDELVGYSAGSQRMLAYRYGF